MLSLLTKAFTPSPAFADRHTCWVEADRSLLYSCFDKHLSICEIGVQDGTNALALYNVIQPKQLYLIDPWQVFSWQWLKEQNNFTDDLIASYKDTLTNWHKEADVNDPDKTYQYFYDEVCKRFRDKDHVTIIRQFSENAVDDIPNGAIDLLYVDGNHTYDYVYRDLTLYEPKLSAKGVIMGNDFLKSCTNPYLTHYDVISAVLDFCNEKPEWHILLINNNPFADFILSRDGAFDRRFMKAIKDRKFGVKQLNSQKLNQFLMTSNEIDFSKIANETTLF